MIFHRGRDLLAILRNFTGFFRHESCGMCTPCRAGNFLIERKLEKIAQGLGYVSDYDDIRQWGKIMHQTSRCGLGQSATNALCLALDRFPEYFTKHVDEGTKGMSKKFNLEEAIAPYEQFKN
jgi:[NiFe] hydrogenase diaphorase moiety large subunit